MEALMIILSVFTSMIRSQTAVTPSILELLNNNAYYNGLDSPQPTKQGPVLFPNDGPPPARPPLIVTSKPLAETIAQSNLTPEQNVTNSDAGASNVNAYRAGYLSRLKNYQPYNFAPPLKYPVIFVNPTTGTAVEREYDIKGFQNGYGDEFENHIADDFEVQPTLPPIYKALSDHATQKALDVQRAKARQNIRKAYKRPVFSQRYETNDLGDGSDGSDYDHNSNYAFSYRVKDRDTGDDFSHSQRSTGQATNGEYRVKLPDGRTQIVSYTADENGYKADVRYDDEDRTVHNSVHDYHYDKHVGNPSVGFSNVGNDVLNYKGDVHNPYIGLNNEAAIFNNNGDTRLNEKVDKDYKINERYYKGDVGNYYNDYVGANHFDVNNLISDVDKYGGGSVHFGKANNIRPSSDINSKINYNYHSDIDTGNSIKNDFDSYKSGTKTQNQNDYKVKDEDYNDGKDYYNDDYSNEYDNSEIKYEPHESKFEKLTERKAPRSKIGVIVVPSEDAPKRARVRPSIASLRKLFLNRLATRSRPIPVEINVPSTTPNPNYKTGTTENVVVIGGNRPLYTNINGPSAKTAAYDNTTPSSYLATTISGIRNVNLSGNKPVLTESFIERINKYLTF